MIQSSKEVVSDCSSLPSTFFEQHHLEVAQALIGTELHWNGCSGIVVETEAYGVEGDAACHVATRPSTREFVSEQAAGTAYVYLNYGMYWLVNVLVKDGPADGIILIRALEPVEGIGQMRRRRKRDKLTDLCSGPGKLTIALGIDGSHHGRRIAANRACGFRKSRLRRNFEILQDTRIGISKATELPWRFLMKGNPHLSVRPSPDAKAILRSHP